MFYMLEGMQNGFQNGLISLVEQEDIVNFLTGNFRIVRDINTELFQMTGHTLYKIQMDYKEVKI